MMFVLIVHGISRFKKSYLENGAQHSHYVAFLKRTYPDCVFVTRVSTVFLANLVSRDERKYLLLGGATCYHISTFFRNKLYRKIQHGFDVQLVANLRLREKACPKRRMNRFKIWLYTSSIFFSPVAIVLHNGSSKKWILRAVSGSLSIIEFCW